MDTPVPTPEAGWPAQPALTPSEVYKRMVCDDIAALVQVSEVLADSRRLRLSAVRHELRRMLAGVIADCETVRLALEKGRGA